jgi:hypothetical protein
VVEPGSHSCTDRRAPPCASLQFPRLMQRRARVRGGPTRVCALGLSCGLRPQPNWSVGRAQWIHNKTRPFKAFIHSSSSTDPRADTAVERQFNESEYPTKRFLSIILLLLAPPGSGNLCLVSREFSTASISVSSARSTAAKVTSSQVIPSSSFIFPRKQRDSSWDPLQQCLPTLSRSATQL